MADSATPPFSPTIALLTLARDAELEVARLLEPRGLTLRKYTVLGWIARTPGLSPGELARRTGIAAPTIQSITTSLVDAGLVRSVAPNSGHTPLLSATPAGSDLLTRLESDVAALDARAFADPAMQEIATALSIATSPQLGPPQD